MKNVGKPQGQSAISNLSERTSTLAPIFGSLSKWYIKGVYLCRVLEESLCMSAFYSFFA